MSSKSIRKKRHTSLRVQANPPHGNNLDLLLESISKLQRVYAVFRSRLFLHIEEQDTAFRNALDDLDAKDWVSKGFTSLRTQGAVEIAEGIRHGFDQLYRPLSREFLQSLPNNKPWMSLIAQEYNQQGEKPRGMKRVATSIETPSKKARKDTEIMTSTAESTFDKPLGELGQVLPPARPYRDPRSIGLRRNDNASNPSSDDDNDRSGNYGRGIRKSYRLAKSPPVELVKAAPPKLKKGRKPSVIIPPREAHSPHIEDEDPIARAPIFYTHLSDLTIR